MAQRVAISRVENNDVETAVRRAIELAGGLRELITPHSQVLVKPNLVQPAPSGSGCVTDARVVEAVTRAVLEMAPRSVIIADGSAAGYDTEGFSTEDAFQATGIAEVARRLGVELRNLNTDQFEEVSFDKPLVMDRARIARTVLDSDVIVSVPVLKTNLRTNVTLSIKNMNGALPGAEKRKPHHLGVDRAIVDLYSVLRPSYAVLDATVGLEGMWHYPEDSREMGLVIAGRDALAVDIVGASLMGFEPAQVLHLRLLAERQGVNTDPAAIEIVGEPLLRHRQQFKTAFQVLQAKHPGVRFVQGESACSACICEMASPINYLREAGYAREMEGLTVIIGNPTWIEFKGKTAALGDCAREFAGLGPFAPGCPPKEDDVIRALCQICGADPDRVMSFRDEARRQLWESADPLLKR